MDWGAIVAMIGGAVLGILILVGAYLYTKRHYPDWRLFDDCAG